VSLLFDFATKNLHLATIFYYLVAKWQLNNFVNFEPCAVCINCNKKLEMLFHHRLQRIIVHNVASSAYCPCGKGIFLLSLLILNLANGDLVVSVEVTACVFTRNSSTRDLCFEFRERSYILPSK